MTRGIKSQVVTPSLQIENARLKAELAAAQAKIISLENQVQNLSDTLFRKLQKEK